jgi:hypothetical protein
MFTFSSKNKIRYVERAQALCFYFTIDSEKTEQKEKRLQRMKREWSGRGGER